MSMASKVRRNHAVFGQEERYVPLEDGGRTGPAVQLMGMLEIKFIIRCGRDHQDHGCTGLGAEVVKGDGYPIVCD